ncbi:hypothetical protein JW964_12385 [candidate division KSB1 bacterium]|nr:hypothetical protein [candidate division KSB1 bacterium]
MRISRNFVNLISSLLCWLLCTSLMVFSQEKTPKVTSDSIKAVNELKSNIIQSADTLKNKEQTTSNPATTTSTEIELIQTDGDGEMILNAIEIEAVIETPSVNIVPKRINPEMGKVEFVDRSFESELKAIPIQPILTGKEMSEVSKIKKLKTDKIKSKTTSTEKKAE